MKGLKRTVPLLVGAGMIVVFFVSILPGLPFGVMSPVIVAVYWLLIAIMIAPPLADFFGEKLAGVLLREGRMKVTKEYSVAKSLAAQGKFEEAIEEFRRGLEKEPDRLMLRLEIAEIYARDIKDYRRAILELEECLKIRLGPTQGGSVLNRIADIYEVNLGDVEAALTTLARIAEKWPGSKPADRAQKRIESIRNQVQKPG